MSHFGKRSTALAPVAADDLTAETVGIFVLHNGVIRQRVVLWLKAEQETPPITSAGCQKKMFSTCRNNVPDVLFNLAGLGMMLD
jgi:hypothetical protein